MCEELLGYLLGALEPEEAAQVEAKLEADPALRRELEALRDRLQPLIDDAGDRHAWIDPPADLADRVCERVEDVRRAEAAADADLVRPAEPVFAATAGSSPRRADVASIIGVSLAALVLFVPVLASQRYRSEAVACRQKLQNVGRALVAYSRNHHGYFPEIPSQGNLSRAGVYAVKLREANYLVDDSDLYCPAVNEPSDRAYVVPARAAFNTASPAEADGLFEEMNGVHGYALGYTSDGRYHALRNRDRATYAVLGDSPHEFGGAGRNHGCGQNLWFEDGHAEFLRSSRLPSGDDAIYQNRHGNISAGVDENDVVLGAAAAAPLLTPVSR